MKIAVIILGKPSSGKDTQVDLLARRFKLVWLQTSAIISKEIRKANHKRFSTLEGEHFNIFKEKIRLETGLLCTARFVSALIKREIRRVAAQGKGVAFSGSPRKIFEVRQEIPLLDALYPRRVFIFYLDVPDGVARKRALLRLRKDFRLDTPKALRKRFREFYAFTWPVVKYFRSKGRLIVVDGRPAVPVIHKNILRILRQKIAATS